MGDSESLVLVLVILYLLECLVWIPRGGVVMGSWGGRSFRLRHPGNLLGNTRGGWHLASPFPPLGTVLFCQQFPFSVSPEGVFAYCSFCLDPADRLRHSGTWWRWEATQSISVRGRILQINGRTFCQAVTPGAAQFLARWLRKIRACTATERPRLIRAFLGAMLDTDRTEARWRLFQLQSRWVRVLCNVTFVFLFGLTPWLLWRHGWVHVGWWVLGGLLVQTTGITLGFRRVYRKLFPHAAEEQFKRVLTMFLAPPAALRAADHLGRPVLEEFHMLAVAKCLLAPEKFQAFARQWLIDLRYPMLPSWAGPTPEAAATEQWFRETVLCLTEGFFGKCGLSSAALLSPPSPSEGAKAFCPRCSAQFILARGFCLDCGGRSLQPLPSTSST